MTVLTPDAWEYRVVENDYDDPLHGGHPAWFVVEVYYDDDAIVGWIEISSGPLGDSHADLVGEVGKIHNAVQMSQLSSPKARPLKLSMLMALEVEGPPTG